MSPARDPIAAFLLVVAVVIAVSHLCGALLRRIGQPPIIGEIVGGLLLGPSVLGALWPSGRAWLFSPEVLKPLDLAAQLGLVIFMFLLGCELRAAKVRARPKTVGLVVTGALGLPFAAGVVVAAAARPLMAGPADRSAFFPLFFGLALAITALPVLARILVDLGLDRGPIGTLALTCAAVGDGIMWAVLTVMLGLMSLAGAGSALVTAALALLVTLAVLVLRPLLKMLVRRAERSPGSDGRMLLAVLVAGAIAFSAVTQVIGLHPAIGAFLFGTVVPRDSALVDRMSGHLQGFVLIVLLPLFFAGVGLRTSIGLLGASAANWLLFAVVLAVAAGTKFAGAAAGARLSGMRSADAWRLGAMMNCRGVTELVVATIGWQYGLINDLGLTILVLVALITTALTGPLLRALGSGERAVLNPVLNEPSFF